MDENKKIAISGKEKCMSCTATNKGVLIGYDRTSPSTARLAYLYTHQVIIFFFNQLQINNWPEESQHVGGFSFRSSQEMLFRKAQARLLLVLGCVLGMRSFQ